MARSSQSQPLREAVSWNVDAAATLLSDCVSLFVRLWVEIIILEVLMMIIPVSLFVRLWVEILIAFCENADTTRSASSWGCELKCLKCRIIYRYRWSASSWGCELKCYMPVKSYINSASASSWGCELKWKNGGNTMKRDLSASSWGCELKYKDEFGRWIMIGQPLREAVSWNNHIKWWNNKPNRQPLREAVSWNVLHNLPHVT